jgi:hypothetical protein
MGNAHKMSVLIPEGKIQFERPCLRWKNDPKMDLTEIDSEDIEWIYIPHGSDQTHVHTVMILKFP